MIMVWVAGAAISFAGALCYAELGTAFPQVGGDYHFLTRAYGRRISFLYAWARITVINAGSIALLGFVFGDYLAAAIALPSQSAAIWAAGVVVALTMLNITGLRASACTQNLLSVIQVAGLCVVMIAGFWLPPSPAIGAPFSTAPAPGMLGLALVFVLLTYGGWNEAAYVSAELKDGRRAMLRVLMSSIGIIAVLYLAVNLALLHGLGLDGLRQSKAPGADVMLHAFGSLGGQLLAIGVAIATLTSINATMIVGARTSYALANDWPVLGFLGRWNESRDAPIAAYVFQAVVTLALIGFGALEHDGFAAMVEFTAPVFWAFLLLVGFSLFVLRIKYRDAERPFRVPLYPLTPVVFCLACGYLLYSSINYAAAREAVHVSLGVMAVGVVVLLLLGDPSGTRTRARPVSADALDER
jgi:amino acid transporter